MRVRITVTPDLAERIKAVSKQCPKLSRFNPDGRVVSFLLWYVEQIMTNDGEPLEFDSMMRRLKADATPTAQNDTDLDGDENFSGQTLHGEKVQ